MPMSLAPLYTLFQKKHDFFDKQIKQINRNLFYVVVKKQETCTEVLDRVYF